MRRQHAEALRVHPANNEAFYASLRPSQCLSPRRFHCGSACCRSGWPLVCCLFIEQSARSLLYFAWTQYSFVQSRPIGAMNLCWQPSVTLETFLKDNCLKICIDVLFSCVLSTVFQRLKWSAVKSYVVTIEHTLSWMKSIVSLAAVLFQYLPAALRNTLATVSGSCR